MGHARNSPAACCPLREQSINRTGAVVVTTTVRVCGMTTDFSREGCGGCVKVAFDSVEQRVLVFRNDGSCYFVYFILRING